MECAIGPRRPGVVLPKQTSDVALTHPPTRATETIQCVMIGLARWYHRADHSGDLSQRRMDFGAVAPVMCPAEEHLCMSDTPFPNS